MLKMIAVGRVPKAAQQLKAMRKSWETALQEEGKEISRLYGKTYSNWHHKPQEQVSSASSDKEMYVEVKLTGRIYWFVHESISVLRAVFTDDWQPKTQPRVLSSGAGSGAMVYASKKISKPPYEAREFTEAIVEERQKPFEKRMRDATFQGVKDALAGG